MQLILKPTWIDPPCNLDLPCYTPAGKMLPFRIVESILKGKDTLTLSDRMRTAFNALFVV